MEKNPRGRPKSERGAKTVGLTVSPDSWEKLRIKAQGMGLTRSELVELMAQDHIVLTPLEKDAVGESSTS